MSKKWYNYFIVTSPTGDPSLVPPPSGEAPTRASDTVPDAEGDATFTNPVVTPTDLSEIYESAQIPTPAHGYTVLKVAEMLRSAHLASLPAEVKQKSIMVALDAAGVKVAEIVEDAVQRDRALDTYERVLQKNLEDVRTRTELENQRIEEQINQHVADLRARVEHNNTQMTKEQNDLIHWRSCKRQEEDRIAEAVGYFVSPNPITTSTAPVRDKGDSNVR